MAYSGDMQWRTRAGDEVAARLGEPLTKDLTAQALRTALDPAGSWMPSVLAAADMRLTEVRRHVPDAAGLVIASDQDSARAYAGLLKAATGQQPTVVLSDEKTASQADRRVRRERPTAGWSRCGWSPRASTSPGWRSGVYATTTATPLYFAQAVGRFVRARRRGETASVFLPRCRACWASPPRWSSSATTCCGAAVSDEGDIFAAEDDLLAQAQASEAASAEEALGPFEAMGSEARFDRVLYDGGEFGHAGEVHVGSEEEMDFLGIPGLLEADQVRDLLHSRQSERAQSVAADAPDRARRPEDRAVARRVHPRAAGHAAPRAQRPGRRLEPPHRLSRTASPTPRCAGSAADRPRRWPPPSSCRRGSTGSGAGRPSAAAADRAWARWLSSQAWPPRPRRPWTGGCGCCERLADTPGGLTITALAAEIGVNRTVVYRLVATLEQHGLVRRDAGGRCTSGSACSAGPGPAAGAARAGRAGAAGAGRGAGHDRPPDRRRRRGRRWPSPSSSRAGPTSTSPTGSAPGTRWSGAPPGGRSCRPRAAAVVLRRDAGGDADRRARRGRPGAGGRGPGGLGRHRQPGGPGPGHGRPAGGGRGRRRGRAPGLTPGPAARPPPNDEEPVRLRPSSSGWAPARTSV